MKNRGTTLDDRKQAGIEINTNKTKYFMCHHKDAWPYNNNNNNNNNNNKSNKASENVAKLKYLEQERKKSKLHS